MKIKNRNSTEPIAQEGLGNVAPQGVFSLKWDTTEDREEQGPSVRRTGFSRPQLWERITWQISTPDSSQAPTVGACQQERLQWAKEAKLDFARLQDSKIQGIPQMWTLLCVHLLVASLTGPCAFEISICSVFMI